MIIIIIILKIYAAQSAGAVEYTNSISGEGVRPSPNECPGYDIKSSDGEAASLGNM